MERKPKTKMFKYEVRITKKLDYVGTFTVESDEQLTEEEAIELAQEAAFEGREPNEGWEEVDCRYDEDSEFQSGDIKEE